MTEDRRRAPSPRMRRVHPDYIWRKVDLQRIGHAVAERDSGLASDRPRADEEAPVGGRLEAVDTTIVAGLRFHVRFYWRRRDLHLHSAERKFVVRTDGPDNAMRDYEVTHAIGAGSACLHLYPGHQVPIRITDRRV